MKRKILHDEANNEDYYYESDRGNIWHEVERESFCKCSVCGHGMIVSADEWCPICGNSKWIEI